MNSKVFKDVGSRTSGELYIGVVGSVRSGKSMFIRKFIECKILPFTKEEEKDKIIDELPQSAEGKTIMTVEPKFVPTIPSTIVVDDNVSLNVRLVDCVGYAMKNSKGYQNSDGSPRMVKTPWFTDDIDFTEASIVGTTKVIENHSNIGILITSDGSFGEFTRNDYMENEEIIVDKMKSLNKPFVIVLNTTTPYNESTQQLVKSLEEKYGISVIAINVKNMSEADIDNILNEALEEFDISKLDIITPSWLNSLDDDNLYKKQFLNSINTSTLNSRKFKDAKKIQESLSRVEIYDDVFIDELDSATGYVKMTLKCKDDLYDKVVYDLIGDAYNDKEEFLKLLQENVRLKKTYKKYESCIEQVETTGYGVSYPSIDEILIDTPTIVKQGPRYGINLKAHAPSIHMIKVDVESIFDPIIGSNDQANMLIEKLNKDYEEDPMKMWEMDFFGRKLHEVIIDGIKAKIYMMPDEIQVKLIECLEKIINKNKGGLLAIVL